MRAFQVWSIIMMRRGWVFRRVFALNQISVLLLYGPICVCLFTAAFVVYVNYLYRARVDADYDLSMENITETYAPGKRSAATASTFFFTALLLNKLFTQALENYKQVILRTTTMQNRIHDLCLSAR